MIATHFPLSRLQAALRADGVECIIRPGAQGRSARNFAAVGYYRGCQAIVEHHTVSSGDYPEADIRYIESGKGVGYVIANAYTAVDGTVHLIASGPTYTEGTGGPLGIIPENRANDVAFSNEIASWGEPDSIYPARQQDAVLAFAYHAGWIAADVWSWPGNPFAPHRAFAHHEWTDRKVDTRGVSLWSPNGGEWDMDMFRADLNNYDTSGDDDMTPIAPERAYDSREQFQHMVNDSLRDANKALPLTPFKAWETREVVVGYTTGAFVNVTAVAVGTSPGYISINDTDGKTSVVGFTPGTPPPSNGVPVSAPVGGKIKVTCCIGRADVVVDVFARA